MNSRNADHRDLKLALDVTRTTIASGSPYLRILHYWIDSEAAPANGGSGM